jgi:transposase
MPPADPSDELAALRARLLAAERRAADAEGRAADAEARAQAAAAESARLTTALGAEQAARAALQTRLDGLLRNLHRPKAEKVDPEELERAFVAAFGPDEPEPPVKGAEPARDDEETPATKRERRKHPGRKPLPPELERVVEERRPPPQTCCDAPMTDAGVEYAERLDLVREHYRVRRIATHKLACRTCGRNVVRPGPAADHPLEKCGATVELLAHVVASKYDRHVPLHRLAAEAARLGVPLAKSTLCGWVADVAFVLAPIVRELRREVLAGDVVNFDDTGVLVLDPTTPHGSRKGYLWIYRGPESAFFEYTPARVGAGPAAALAPFRGYAQCDAASQHDGLFVDGSGRTEVGCMAHCRRKFFAAAPTDGAVAKIALAFIQRLYRIEHEARGATPEERTALRRRRALPLWRKFMVWARAEAPKAVPKSPLGKAFGYLLRHRAALRRYLDDGRLTPDNNAAERGLRVVALGRNNWEFAGSDEGAARAAALYSLTYSCRLAGVDPEVYLADVLRRVSTTPQADVATLTPRGWKAARAAEAAAAVVTVESPAT